MYGGMAVMFFFLVIFLQQVAGFTALQSGLATLPSFNYLECGVASPAWHPTLRAARSGAG